jgi:hypothetical protein
MLVFLLGMTSHSAAYMCPNRPVMSNSNPCTALLT